MVVGDGSILVDIRKDRKTFIYKTKNRKNKKMKKRDMGERRDE